MKSKKGCLMFKEPRIKLVPISSTNQSSYDDRTLVQATIEFEFSLIEDHIGEYDPYAQMVARLQEQLKIKVSEDLARTILLSEKTTEENKKLWLMLEKLQEKIKLLL
jgi:hypothetical protein